MQTNKNSVFLRVLLFHFADSNQTRQRKRRKIRELKNKLRQKIVLYNTIAEDTIDGELASNLTEDYILPWERSEDGMVAYLDMFSKMYAYMPMV